MIVWSCNLLIQIGAKTKCGFCRVRWSGKHARTNWNRGLSESRVNLTGAPALLQCGANLAAAPALLQHQACHIRAVRVHSPGSQVASGQGPHAGIQGQAAGTRQQAPGTRQQAGGREVEEHAEAKLKAIFHTNRCENHCTVLLFC